MPRSEFSSPSGAAPLAGARSVIFSGRTPTRIESVSCGPTRSDGTRRRAPSCVSTVARLPWVAPSLPSIRFETPRKFGDELGARALVEVGGAAGLLDPAVVHHGDRVGHRHGLLLVVRDVHEGDADVLLDALELDLELLAQAQVERAERLVEQQGARAVDERAGERDALLLAAGELAGLALAEVAELDQLERLGRRACGPRPCRPCCRSSPKRDVALDAQVGEERVGLEDRVDVALVRRALRDVVAAEEDAAVGRAPRSRRSSAASWSCRSPTGRAGRRTRRAASRDRARRPPIMSPKRFVTRSRRMSGSPESTEHATLQNAQSS